jgi:hypothetical protein
MNMLMVVGKPKPIQISQSILDAALHAVQQTNPIIRTLVHGEGVIDDKAKMNHLSLTMIYFIIIQME